MKLRRFIILTILISLLIPSLCGCQNNKAPSDFSELKLENRMTLDYATQFSVDYYEGGYKLISLGDGSRFFVVPEGSVLPSGLGDDVVALYQPIKNIYLAATSAMCLFDALDRLDAIRLSGTKEDGWYIENARKEMSEGNIVYAGKYSEPDYELLLAEDCKVAVESMMIGHSSDVKEQLERLGIAIIVDQSSNETHPLGRAEWIRFYGALLNEEEKAEQIFREQIDILNSVIEKESTGKTVSFFYISSTGRVVARKSGDYVCKMIELAGGRYAFDSLGDPTSKMSTVTLEMEAFFEAAKDADVMIYNGTIAGEVKTIDELVQKNALLKEFKAVQNGNVWCTERNMYQETTELGTMVQSFRSIFEDDGTLDQVPFFFKLK